MPKMFVATGVIIFYILKLILRIVGINFGVSITLQYRQFYHKSVIKTVILA